MRREESTERPSVFLDDWKRKYGMTDPRRRSPSTEGGAVAYARLSEWSPEHGERRSRWVVGSTGESLHDLFAGLFEDIATRLKDDREMELGDRCVGVECLLVMSHAEGRFAPPSPDDPDVPIQGDWDSMPEEYRTFLEMTADPESIARAKAGMMPCLMVNLVCDAGLAAEVVMFPSGDDPIVERIEQYAGDAPPESRGVIDDVLMNTFGFLLLIEEATRQNQSFDFGGLMRAAANSGSEYAPSMIAYLLRVVASGFASGVLDLGDLDGFGDV